MQTHPLLEIIKEKFDYLSPNDKRIADFFLNNQIITPLETVDSLAKKIKVSKSAIVRFASRIGYKNFRTLQKELRQHFFIKKNELESPLDLFSKSRNLGDTGEDILREQFKKNIDNINTTYKGIQMEQFNEVLYRMSRRTGRIFIMGQRKSYSLAVYLYTLLNPMLDNIYLLENRESFLTDNLLSINKQDLLIVFSFKRYAKVSIAIAEYFVFAGAKVVLVTDSHVCPASRWANYFFICASEGKYVFDSNVSAICLIEAIASALARQQEKVVGKRLKKSEDLLKRFQILQK
jgi:DNA-binding MurR/RpiR family transcriptional regulator